MRRRFSAATLTFFLMRWMINCRTLERKVDAALGALDVDKSGSLDGHDMELVAAFLLRAMKMFMVTSMRWM